MANEIFNLATNRAYKIEIFSFSNPEGRQLVEFPAFLTDFSDSYKSNWREEEVMGKMDPVVTFKNTMRTISLAFDIPNASREEAIKNMDQISIIIRGLYPIYDEGKYGTAVMVSPPMFRVRFSNLVRNVGQTADEFKLTPNPEEVAAALADDEDPPGERDINTLRTGLLSYIKQFDFKPDVGSGFFVSNEGVSLYPKLIKAALNLNIIHENPLGNYKDGNGVQPRVSFFNFPYRPTGRFSVKETQKTQTSSDTQPENKKEEVETQRSFKKCLNFE